MTLYMLLYVYVYRIIDIQSNINKFEDFSDISHHTCMLYVLLSLTLLTQKDMSTLSMKVDKGYSLLVLQLIIT